jgi:hypothetical protein
MCDAIASQFPVTIFRGSSRCVFNNLLKKRFATPNISNMSDCSGSASEAHRDYLGVPCVPKAASWLSLLSVSYIRGNRPSPGIPVGIDSYQLLHLTDIYPFLPLSFTPFGRRVPVHQSGTVFMPLLTENQLTEIVDMIVDDYGTRLTGGEMSEIAALILENISGFETVDSQTLTQTINEIGKQYDESVK